jgi:AcrR family transcriptional regulator
VARYRVGLETRQRILDATREILVECGFDGVTLKAITDRANVGSGSFYNLFESKEEAVFEVVREAITAVDPGGETDESVRDLIDAFVAFIAGASTALARIYLQLAIGGGLTDERIARRVLRSHRARVERFADAVRRERPDWSTERSRAQAEALLAALTGFAVTSLLDPDFDLEGHAAGIWAA